MSTPSSFVQPPLALFTDARLTDGDRTVYCLLASFGDHGTLANCHPSLGAVAKRGNRDRSGIVKSLVRLIAAGWVTRDARMSADGDQDTSLYSFPLHRVVDSVTYLGDETHRPSGRNAPTLGDETHRGVGDETHHNLEPVHLEPKPKSYAPDKPAQEAFTLTADEPKATPKWAKAKQVADLWNEAMPCQVKCKPDARNSGVLAAAFDSHGLDGLRDLFAWAQTDDWMCGRKGKPSHAQAWLSKGGLATAEQKRANGMTTTKAQEAEDYYKRG